MKMKYAIIGLALVLVVGAAWAGSTINPAVPAQNSPMSSAPIRANFTAAYNDINNILTQFSGTLAPLNPSVNQQWMNTSAVPWIQNIWDGGQWVPQATLNPNTHTWSVASSSAVTGITGTANQITASANVGPVTLSLPSSVVFPGTIQTTNAYTQLLTFDFPGTTNPIAMQAVTGVNGRRLSIQAQSTTGSAEVQIIPGATLDPATNLTSQIILYNKIGTNYERFSLSNVDNQFIIDYTAHDSGVIRDVYMQTGGYIYSDVGKTSLPSQNALEMVNDASVILNGATFTTNYNGGTQNWGAQRTTIGDWTNTGQSALIVDTRTSTPASNTADKSWIEYRRGGVAEWSTGLNLDGKNTDDFNITSASGTNVARFTTPTAIFQNDGSTALIARFVTTNAQGPYIRLDNADGNPVAEWGACAAITTGNPSNVCVASRGTTSVILAPNDLELLKVASTGIVTMPAYGAGTATFDASGNISSFSDERLKNISKTPFDPSLEDLAKVKPIIYRWNAKSGLEQNHYYAGFSAQNVRSAFGTQYANLVTGKTSTGYYTLQDRALLAGAYVFIQKLQKQVVNDNARLTVLEKENKNILSRLAALEKRSHK